MVLALLEEQEIVKIYEERMPEDFAKGEIKPLARILELYRQGKYFCYGLYEEEKLAGYCFLVVSEKRDAVLLDYFAISKDRRGMGCGSICLGLLKEETERRKFGTLILEVENPRFGKDEEEKALRRRRIAFYTRNGMTLTHLRIFLYDVEYLVMTAQKEEMFRAAEQIYHTYQVLLKPDKIGTKLRISTNIRCFVSDMDRTALNERGEFSLRTRNAILQALKEGIYVIVASGRAYDTLPEDVASIPGIEYVISSNGASVWHKGEYVRRRVLKEKAVLSLWEIYKKEREGFSVAMEVFCQGKAFCGQEYYDDPAAFGATRKGVEYVKRTRQVIKDLGEFVKEHAGKLESISFISNDRENREKLKRKMAYEVSEISITSSMEHFIEISGENVSKGESLEWLLKELHVEREECVAFGDGDNDAEMLSYAGIGVAVENASQLAKNTANFVTKPHFQDGVAIIMEEILQNCVENDEILL